MMLLDNLIFLSEGRNTLRSDQEIQFKQFQRDLFQAVTCLSFGGFLFHEEVKYYVFQIIGNPFVETGTRNILNAVKCLPNTSFYVRRLILVSLAGLA
ncbi:hypothetical protein CEXT_647051 [Caerostris extrusa]|uniref:Uncharacterized protein n=1 Tax=Caerostris extrusa TaxID=172846 RepID=A0AAV4VRT6_CAEEX|nr:hypothetical protein CEXT_647051 [Caerostris extrusa]